MMLSKNAGSFPEDRAHAISTTATAAAARITRAYSAVVCPTCSDSRTRARTYQDRNTAPLLSTDRPHGGQQDGDHREEEESGEDEEHEGEEHLHRCGPRPLDRAHARSFADLGCKASHLFRQRGTQALGAKQESDRPPEVVQPESVPRSGDLVPPAPTEIEPACRDAQLDPERAAERVRGDSDGELWGEPGGGRHGE